MGRACIRFKRVDDRALDVIAEAIRRVPARKYIEHCLTVLDSCKKARANSARKLEQQAPKSRRRGK
jgi:hypothetical protein